MKPWPILLCGMKLLAYTSLSVAGVLAIIYLPRLGAGAPPGGSAGGNPAEFITIILTAVTVILAALAIILALAGVAGYYQIRDAAQSAAKAAAKPAAEEVAAKVAAEKVAEMVPRLVEATLAQTTDRDQGAGDDIAKAAGGNDHAGNTGQPNAD